MVSYRTKLSGKVVLELTPEEARKLQADLATVDPGQSADRNQLLDLIIRLGTHLAEERED